MSNQLFTTLKSSSTTVPSNCVYVWGAVIGGGGIGEYAGYDEGGAYDGSTADAAPFGGGGGGAAWGILSGTTISYTVGGGGVRPGLRFATQNGQTSSMSGSTAGSMSATGGTAGGNSGGGVGGGGSVTSALTTAANYGTQSGASRNGLGGGGAALIGGGTASSGTDPGFVAILGSPGGGGGTGAQLPSGTGAAGAAASGTTGGDGGNYGGGGGSGGYNFEVFGGAGGQGACYLNWIDFSPSTTNFLTYTESFNITYDGSPFITTVTNTDGATLASTLSSGTISNTVPGNSGTKSRTVTYTAINTKGSRSTFATTILPQPPTVDIKINGGNSTVSITTGDYITLSWTSTKAETVTINQSIGSVATSGNLTQSPPTGFTTYTITATNGDGLAATDSVSVQAYAPATISSFTASPNPATQDTTTTLSWTTTNASSLSIDQGIGGGLASNSSKDVIATVPSSGPGSFPGAPTYGNGYRIYTMTAKNVIGDALGTATKTLQLDVIPQPPTCTLSISPTTINFGESSSLSWVTTYSNTGSIDQGIGTVTPIASGSKTVTVSGNPNNYKSNSSITYTMSVEGYGGKTTRSTSLTVLVDSSPNSWAFNSKSAAKINTQYYASSNNILPS